MNKMMIALMGVLLAMSACNQEQTKNTEKATVQKEAVAAPAPQAAPATPAAPISVESQTIDWAKAAQLAEGGAIYVDVRSVDEFNSGNVPSALNIPLPEVPRRLAELPKDKVLLIYCRSGRRSASATSYLLQNGYEKVYNVSGGFLAYPGK